MGDVTAQQSLAAGAVALAAGRWEDARTTFEHAVAVRETGDGHFGLAAALWWLGDNHGSVAHCTRAYSLFRRSGESAGAVQCALWLGIVYKANLANFVVANGWISRADRLLESLDQGSLHAQSWVARAVPDGGPPGGSGADRPGADARPRRRRRGRRVDGAVATRPDPGRPGGDGCGPRDDRRGGGGGAGRRALDARHRRLYVLRHAQRLRARRRRGQAARWCEVADDFVQTYGCPFLYAECRIYYGSVLTAKGRWDDAEQELTAGLRITDRACPGLHARALSRLAGLRVRQGRLEEAEQLLDRVGHGVDAEAEASLWRATLLLARGDGLAASRALAQRLDDLADHRLHLAGALDLLVDAHISAGDQDAAEAAAERLSESASGVNDEQLAAMAAAARGRVSFARSDVLPAPRRVAHPRGRRPTFVRRCGRGRAWAARSSATS
jgi:tetratricopeptide (TPR) repeat protein